MRISDWSSDVCSSDLGPVRRGFRSGLRTGVHGWRSSTDQVSSNNRLHDDASDNGRTPPPGSTRPAIAAPPLLAPNPLFIVIIKRARMGALLDKCRSCSSYWTASRSEEHTSELQSLMRISYAVFCLKKKNNRENNHTI